MLRSTKELMGYRLNAVDGRIGRSKDILFDDRQWTARYLVADTGNWLSERKVIISTGQLGEPDWNDRSIPVKLTVKQIEDAPSLDADAPVSRRYERLWLKQFHQPLYWPPIGPTGVPAAADMATMNAVERKAAKAMAEEAEETTNLRSIAEVSGYHIRAKDGEIGHVDEFIVDDETWSLRYVVVDTRRWIPGGKVLLSSEWLRRVSWPEHAVGVGLSRARIEESPKYNPAEPVNREYETRLYDYCGRPHYWLEQ